MKDKCFACGKLAQFNFHIKIPVCSNHWNMVYHLKIPDHIPKEQVIDYQKKLLMKTIKENNDN